MNLWILMAMAFISATITIYNIISFRSLMARIEQCASKYLAMIGRPNSLSAAHISLMLDNLYRKSMSRECEQANCTALLARVRVLFPASFLINVFFILLIGQAINTSRG